MAHGTRSCYQAGCRELVCRAAHARYHRDLRRRRAKGLPILGQLVSAVEARRRVRQLKLEGYTQARLAEMYGRHDDHLPRVVVNAAIDPQHTLIRLVTLAKIRRLATFAMVEGSFDTAPSDPQNQTQSNATRRTPARRRPEEGHTLA